MIKTIILFTALIQAYSFTIYFDNQATYPFKSGTQNEPYSNFSEAYYTILNYYESGPLEFLFSNSPIPYEVSLSLFSLTENTKNLTFRSDSSMGNEGFYDGVCTFVASLTLNLAALYMSSLNITFSNIKVSSMYQFPQLFYFYFDVGNLNFNAFYTCFVLSFQPQSEPHSLFKFYNTKNLAIKMQNIIASTDDNLYIQPAGTTLIEGYAQVSIEISVDKFTYLGETLTYTFMKINANSTTPIGNVLLSNLKLRSSSQNSPFIFENVQDVKIFQVKADNCTINIPVFKIKISKNLEISNFTMSKITTNNNYMFSLENINSINASDFLRDTCKIQKISYSSSTLSCESCSCLSGMFNNLGASDSASDGSSSSFDPIGIIVGVVLGLIALIILSIFIQRYRKNSSKKNSIPPPQKAEVDFVPDKQPDLSMRDDNIIEQEPQRNVEVHPQEESHAPPIQMAFDHPETYKPEPEIVLEQNKERKEIEERKHEVENGDEEHFEPIQLPVFDDEVVEVVYAPDIKLAFDEDTVKPKIDEAPGNLEGEEKK